MSKISELQFSYIQPEIEKPKETGAGIGRTIGDMGIKLGQGVVDLGAGVVGLGSLATGGEFGKAMRATGFDPVRTNQMLGEYLSDDQKAAEAKVAAADGFVDSAVELIENPRALSGSITQSLPAMATSMGITSALASKIALRAAMGTGEGAAAHAAAINAGRSGAEAAKAALSTQAGSTAAQSAVEAASGRLIATGAASEGAQGGGHIADNAQAAGRSYSEYALPSLAAGAGTGLLAFGAGKLMGDAATQLATGSRAAGMTGSIPSRIGKAAFSEGVLEEMPQSAQEQYFTNIAMGEQDRMKGVAAAGGSGLVTGAAMGGIMGGFQRHSTPRQAENGQPGSADAATDAPLLPESGALTRAANAGLRNQPYTGMDAVIQAAKGENPSLVRELTQPRDAFHVEPADDAPQSIADLLARPAPAAQASAIPESVSNQTVAAPAEELLVNGNGLPFMTRFAAELKNKQLGDIYDVVPMDDGFALQLRQQQKDPSELLAARQSMSAPTGFGEHAQMEQLLAEARAKSQVSVPEVQEPSFEEQLRQVDERTQASDVQRAAEARQAIIDSVVNDTSIPMEGKKAAFAEALHREGYRDTTVTEADHAAIDSAINAATPIGTPNEMEVETLVPEKSAPVTPVGKNNFTKVNQAIKDGYKLTGKALISPTGKRFNLNSAELKHATKMLAKNEPAAPSAALGVLRGDIQHPKGFPFKTKIAAKDEQKKQGGTVVSVPGGYVVRPDARTVEPTPVVPEEAKTATPVQAETKSKEWHAFGEDSGTLNIPRSEMPQIKAEHRGAMVNFFKGRDIESKQETVKADSLKPTQMEYSPAKVEAAKNHEGGNRSILVSSDGHVLDGHHQWLAQKEQGQEVNIIRLDTPIKDLLEAVKQFPSAQAAEGSTEAKASQEDKTSTAESDDDGKSKSRIEDFGEKIVGAKKELWASYQHRITDELPGDLSEITLSKHFPEPDYEKMIAGGSDIRVLAAIKAMRDELPTKPKMPYKLKSWAEQVKVLRQFASELVNGKIEIGQLLSKMQTSKLTKFAEKIKLYVDLGYPNFKLAKGYSIEEGHYTVFNGVSYPGGIDRTEILKDNRHVAFFSDYQQALAALSANLAVAPERTGRTVKLDLYTMNSGREVIIGKKVASNKYIDLKSGFSTAAEARKYLAEHESELLELLAKKKQVLPERRDANAPRVGVDRLSGENVSPEKFAGEFGFRGVQFGNYVEQSKRANDLNNAYDALLDLADMINIPSRAVSLNGTLGLAFGARGSGGKNAASAHYESNNVVINLTKSNGAGSLAHEWWHALDNYFGRMRGSTQDNLTDSPKVKKVYGPNNKIIDDTSIRPETIAAFNGVVKAIEASGMPFRSIELDNKQSKNYWSTIAEMSARAFESYIIDKASALDKSNDYLANILGEDLHRVRNEMLGENEPYPYPTKDEAQKINSAFDALFNTLKTKETEKGIALFRRGGFFGMFDQGIDKVDLSNDIAKIVKNWGNAPKINSVQSVEDLPFEAPDDARGAFHNGQAWLVADNLQNTQEAQFVLFHEVLGHAGLRGAFGEDLAPALRSIGMKNRKIAEAAAKWRKENADIKGNRSDDTFLTLSIEEVLADMAGTGREINGLEKLLAKLQSVLRAIGLDKVANWLENATNAEALQMLALAREHIELGAKSHVFGDVEARALSRTTPPTLEELLASNPEEITIEAPIVSKAEIERAASVFLSTFPEGTAKHLSDSATVRKAKRYSDRAAQDLARAGGNPEEAQRRSSHALGPFTGYTTEGRIEQDLFGRDHLIIDVFGKEQTEADLDDIPALTIEVGNDGEFSIYALPSDTSTYEEFVKRGWAEPATGKNKEIQYFAGADGAFWTRLTGSKPSDILPLLGDIHARVLAWTGQPYVGLSWIRSTGASGGIDGHRAAILFSRSGKGTFAEAHDILRSANTLSEAASTVRSLFDKNSKFNIWDRTIGTQFNKAKKDADFKKVFDASQQQIDDTAHFAIEAERLAPSILRRLDSIRDNAKAVFSSDKDHQANLKAVSEALFANIEGKKGVQQKVFTDAELRSNFNLTDSQIEMYREARLAVETSLDRLAQSTIASMGQANGMDISNLKNATVGDTVQAVKDYFDNGTMNKGVPGTTITRSDELYQRIDDLVAFSEELKSKGYMPAMRFGEHTVLVTDPSSGDVVYFGMHETHLKANMDYIKAQKDFAGMKVEKGRLNKDAFAMFKGVSPETIELFSKFTGTDKNEAFQEYIALAKASRSSMKRMLERQGIAGFSKDLDRVLASFITSNARQTSVNANAHLVTEALSSEMLAKKGDVQREAQKLVEYLSNPQEEAQKLRGYMFLHFIGGSIASAAVNLTQPVLQTTPFLSQYAGKKTASIMASSAKMAVTGNVSDHELANALARAKADGITDPHEIHNLMADASGSTLGTSVRARAITKLWGSFFSASEAYNRRLTFLAAYQTGQGMTSEALKETGFETIYDFAKNAIIETQGLYSKANRPNWARGAVGATLFTFKQFSISYVEFLTRLPAKQKMLALGLLVLAAGLQGLPFADDIEDLIDTVGESLGYNTNSKKALRLAMKSYLGETLGGIVTNGLSTQTGVDLHGRLGMGNLIPGSAIFKQSETDKSRDVLEAAGAFGGILQAFMKSVGKVQDGDIFGPQGALMQAAPGAVKNVAQSVSMATSGYYKDTRGRNVEKVGLMDAAAKAVGLQPQHIAEGSRARQDEVQDIAMIKNVQANIADKWAHALAEDDQGGVTDARKEMLDWNEKNPDSKIRIDVTTIRRRVIEMRKTANARLLKTAPKSTRASVREALN